MALKPINEIHALQIQAGILGRNTGHEFEQKIATEINGLQYPRDVACVAKKHVLHGNPATLLIDYIAAYSGKNCIRKAVAISTGALATSEEGMKWLKINGVTVKKCKSDLVITFEWQDGTLLTAGVSTKQCNNKTPTNAQLYFTTAQGFANLLQREGIPVSVNAIYAMKQFCGDVGYRPLDTPSALANRTIDPRRWFWEEINASGREEWEKLFTQRQDDITRLLLQKAYLDDPFTPDFLIHKTKASPAWNQTEIAIYAIDELITLSRNYGSFSKKQYSVKKGSYKDPPGIHHDAPRFGVVQMQRGGQAQHPTQLQFNLEAGYFYKI
jgi:hypothetical protein